MTWWKQLIGYVLSWATTRAIDEIERGNDDDPEPPPTRRLRLTKLERARIKKAKRRLEGSDE